MPRPNDPVSKALTELQRLVRRPAVDDPALYVSNVVVDDHEPGSEATTLMLLADEHAAISSLVASLKHDLRFEHLPRPGHELYRFIRACLRDRDSDQVTAFVTAHAHEPRPDTVFIPVTSLTIPQEIAIGSIRLLPPDAVELPITPGEHIRAVAAIPVEGTDANAMVDRARVIAESDLRRFRVALRADRWIHEAQLRFRLGPQFALASGPSGLITPGDVSWDLEVHDELVQTVATQQLAQLPTKPANKLEQQIELALTWIEATYFAPDPMVQAFTLCFALEALLGRKSDGEKGRGLAMRRAVLAQVIRGTFAHPNLIYNVYDQVRSTAVHGEIPPPIDRKVIAELAFDVRLAVDEVLTFARAEGVHKRSKVLAALERQTQWAELDSWLRKLNDLGWTDYLDKQTVDRQPPPAEGS